MLLCICPVDTQKRWHQSQKWYAIASFALFCFSAKYGFFQIPLGVLLFNENKLDEMGHILNHYMTLVPAVEVEGQTTLPNGKTITFDDTHYFPILFGGDQVTVARVRGVQLLRDTEVKRVDRFEGIVPVVEDWHTRMTVMKVSDNKPV